MSNSDKALRLLLYGLGISSLFALVPVFMPFSWMLAIHRWLGLGEMPAAPVVEYLARSASVLYALYGALCLAVVVDLERYRPLVRFLGAMFILLSLILFGVDIVVGMPWWWTVWEGPGSAVLGVLMFLLARPTRVT
jgi:hypothetical protein